MRHHHQGKAIGAGFQLRPAVPPMSHLRHRKPEHHLTPPPPPAVFPGAKAGRLIRQHGQTDDIHPVTVEQTVMIHVHPFRETPFRFALDFDVNQHPRLGALMGVDLDQLVGVAPPQLGIAHHLL